MKTLRKYRKIALRAMLLGLPMIVSTSCDKELLNPIMQTSLSDASAFDTPARIAAQVNGLYASAKSGSFLGGRHVIYNEIRAENFIMNKPNLVTAQQTWLQAVNSSTSEVNGVWSAGYATINRINTFLEGLDANKAKLSDALYANYSGEAKFVRALCYLALVQAYCKPFTADNGASLGMILRLNSEKTGANNDMARSTVAETYALILSDLNAAEAGLPSTYTTAVLYTTHAHKNAAIALKMRVHLVKGDYASVLTDGAKIVSATAPYQAPTGVANKLEASVATVFAGTYAGPESVFSLPFTATEAPGGQNALAYYFNASPGNAEYYLNPTGIVTDPVFSGTTDARRNFILTNTGQKWLSKYKVASTFSDWVPVIRYADVLLMYGEAAARTNDLVKGLAMLNAVRKRADAAYNFPASSVDTQAALINTILKERTIELLGEGFRVPDLQRLMLPLPAKSGPGGVSPAVGPTEAKYIWPVSGNETSINLLCVPNPS